MTSLHEVSAITYTGILLLSAQVNVVALPCWINSPRKLRGGMESHTHCHSLQSSYCYSVLVLTLRWSVL